MLHKPVCSAYLGKKSTDSIHTCGTYFCTVCTFSVHILFLHCVHIVPKNLLWTGMADYLMKAMSKGMHCSGVMKGSNAGSNYLRERCNGWCYLSLILNNAVLINRKCFPFFKLLFLVKKWESYHQSSKSLLFWPLLVLSAVNSPPALRNQTAQIGL